MKALSFILLLFLAPSVHADGFANPFSSHKTPFYFFARGQSMLPAFADGGYILVDPTVSYSSLKPGQTVLYWSKMRGQVIHHRLVKRNLLGYWETRGDNNDRADFWKMGQDAYIGVTELARRNDDVNLVRVGGYPIWVKKDLI